MVLSLSISSCSRLIGSFDSIQKHNWCFVTFEFKSELGLILCLSSRASFELGIDIKFDFIRNLVGFEFKL